MIRRLTGTFLYYLVRHPMPFPSPPKRLKYLMLGRGWVHTRPKYFMRVVKGYGGKGLGRKIMPRTLPLVGIVGAPGILMRHSPTPGIKILGIGPKEFFMEVHHKGDSRVSPPISFPFPPSAKIPYALGGVRGWVGMGWEDRIVLIITI